MTEYDYSPEAYERYMAKQHSISKWVSQCSKHAQEYVDPISSPPRSSSPSEPSDGSSSRSSSPVERGRRPHLHYSQDSYYNDRGFNPQPSRRAHSSYHAPHRHSPSRHPEYFSRSATGPQPPDYDYVRRRSYETPNSAPAHVPYRSTTGRDYMLPTGQSFVIVDGNKIEVVPPSSHPPHSASLYPYPSSGRNSSTHRERHRSPPRTSYSYQQPPPHHSSNYPIPPPPLLSPTYQYPSVQYAQPFYIQPPPPPHRDRDRDRPLLQRMFSKSRKGY